MNQDWGPSILSPFGVPSPFEFVFNLGSSVFKILGLAVVR